VSDARTTFLAAHHAAIAKLRVCPSLALPLPSSIDVLAELRHAGVAGWTQWYVKTAAQVYGCGLADADPPG
jgi:hypothetical protein